MLKVVFALLLLAAPVLAQDTAQPANGQKKHWWQEEGDPQGDTPWWLRDAPSRSPSLGDHARSYPSPDGLYEKGMAQRKTDPKQAVKTLRLAAKWGDARALVGLAKVYREYLKDETKARKWLKLSSSQGNMEARTLWGKTQKADEPEWGMAVIGTAAEAGYAPAQVLYGTALITGDGVSTDKVHGWKWLLLAKKDGEAARRALSDQLTVSERADGRTAFEQWAADQAEADWSESSVRFVQDGLNRQGFGPLAVGGQRDPETDRALEAYAKARHLRGRAYMLFARTGLRKELREMRTSQ